MFDAFAVGLEGLGAVAAFDGAGERGMHGERVVWVGKGAEATRREERFTRSENVPVSTSANISEDRVLPGAGGNG